jgi:hypothetical protein
MAADVETLPNNTPDRSEQLAVVPLGKPLENLLQAVVLANGLAEAGLLPDALMRRPKDVIVILTYGAELGLMPMQSIQGIYVVKGRPMLSAQLWAAKIAQARHKLRVVSSDNERAVIRITRGDTGEVFEEEFSIFDAENAGLLRIVDGKVVARNQKGDKLVWEQWTRAMLRYRALVFCARIACPEVAFNAGIHGEEYDDQDSPDLRPGSIVVEQVVEGSDVNREETFKELAALSAAAKAEHLAPSEEELAAEDVEFLERT